MTDKRDAHVKVYGVTDAPARGLGDERVAILGYGYMGRTAALNLRDSGARVRIGNRDDEYAVRARAEGFEVVPLATAATDDIVFVLLPDEVIPGVFATEIAPALRDGSAVAFASGYSLAFGLIEPPAIVDLLVVAPRMAGESARTRFLRGEGFWACVGVEADRSGRAQQRMLGLADGLGVLRAGAIEMSAKLEATLDLYIEQTVGAVIGQAIMIAFEVAREAGVPGEALVVEMYMSGEMETVFQSFRETGFFRASEAHGSAAIFGGITRTLEMDHAAMAASFRTVLEDIQSGGFARRFQEEERNGYPMLALAREIMHRTSGITADEDHVRHFSSGVTGRTDDKARNSAGCCSAQKTA
jgi:ketol-acid reductoisomerase